MFVAKINGQDIVNTSYSKEDVTILLKDLTNVMVEQSTEERERLIQSGVHYSEMLPEEKEPSKEYMELYEKALSEKKSEIALGIAVVGNIIYSKTTGTPIIVSLARAGIPVGILLKRYIEKEKGVACRHYAISIIRDKGIDINAMEYIYDEICRIGDSKVSNIFFVDGWTGKGVIKDQLSEAVKELKEQDSKWDGLRDDLYVLADPANVTQYSGTREDFLLPSACLNSTVSGLTSRTILNSKIDVKNGDFHGAVYFKKFENIDKSNEFIDEITKEFDTVYCADSDGTPIEDGWTGMKIVNKLCKKYHIQDYKKVKPGIGETTRVLLRRVPWKVIVNTTIDMENDTDIKHILELCKEKNIPIERHYIGHYKVCGIIKDLSADA